MSYILDALKKAEADRDPDTRARLAFEVREQRRNRFITYAVLAALIANAAVLLWVFLPDDLSLGPVTEAPMPAPAMEPVRPAAEAVLPVPAAVATERVAAPPPAAAGRLPEPGPASGAPRPSAAAPAAADDVLIGPQTAVASTTPAALSSLPDAARRRFPALSFSTHIYADDAELRAVVVNGRRLVEGDRLGELQLERITEEGAVFLFEGRRVEVGVLDDWN